MNKRLTGLQLVTFLSLWLGGFVIFGCVMTRVPDTQAPTINAIIGLFMLLWDSAARIGEIMKLKVGDVLFDQYGGVIFVNGKTGKRRIRLTASVPDLQQWLNIHPLKDNPDA
jgi:site-specific recombinase XerC